MRDFRQAVGKYEIEIFEAEEKQGKEKKERKRSVKIRSELLFRRINGSIRSDPLSEKGLRSYNETIL